MSLSGKKTPLALNVEAQLNVNSGFRVNPVAVSFQGVWSAATPYTIPKGSNYVQGSLTTDTVLNKLTSALPNLYNMTPSLLCVTVFRNALMIGRPIDSRPGNDRINCPALGNARPDTFKTSYAGYGTFKSSTMTDKYYNMVPTTANVGLVESIYPPFKYPIDGTSSYVYNNWSSLTSSPGAPTSCAQTSFTPWTQEYQYKHEYAWLTGWPGENSWQSKTPGNPQEAYDPISDADTYAAAYFPRPDLAVSQPWRSRDAGKIEYDEYFRFGFVATIARQAYYEFWTDNNTRRKNQYLEFIRSMQQCYQFQQTTNEKISSYENSQTFIKGNYSNINDLTSSDISGVSLSFKSFGNDLINLGKSLDLSEIHLFGTPSKLLLNLQKNNALTDGVKMALFLSNLSTEELTNILLPTYQPIPSQEKKIYDAFLLVRGQDLNDVRIILNIATRNLESLADLINPKKMFPSSYRTLTVPEYSVSANTSKVYNFIYSDTGVNTNIRNWGGYLEGILPTDLAIACGAFMCTMNQIKNIRQMDILVFSQIVQNLEVTNKGLPQVNGSNGVPVNFDQAQLGSNLFALGNGNSGNYNFTDFFGAMSGDPYIDYYKHAKKSITLLQSKELQNIYEKLYQKSLGNNWALLARGKGWPDAIINNTPVPPEYQYDIITNNSSSGVGDKKITSGYTIDQTYNLYKPGTFVAFNSNPGDPGPSNMQTYEVTSSAGGTVNFLSTYVPAPEEVPPAGWPGLLQSVPGGTKLYIWEPEYNGYPGNGLTDGFVQNLIDAANLEILRIQNANPEEVEKLNYWWDKIGTQLFKEQRAIPFAITQTGQIYEGTNRVDVDSFTRQLETISIETAKGQIASVIENISDTTNIGGQSIIAMLRESRNAQRLAIGGGDLNNDTPDTMPSSQASVKSVVEGGKIVRVDVTYGGWGYTDGPPVLAVYPQGGVFGGSGSGGEVVARLDENFSVSEVIVVNSGQDYFVPPAIYAVPPPNPDNIYDLPTVQYSQITQAEEGTDPSVPGSAIVPGSFAGAPWIIPEELQTDDNASYNTDEAIEEVTICNCDCWNEQ